MGEGGLVAKSLGIVAGGDEERRSGIGSDTQSADELRCRLYDQGLEDGVDLVDLLLKGDGAPSQHPQGELGERRHVALGAGSIGRGPLEKAVDVEATELGPHGFGSSRDQAAHLVERLGPAFARRGPSDPQNPHGFDASVPRLGLAGGVAREGGPGDGDGVLEIGLALESAALAVRAIDFDDADLLGLEMTGQPRTIGARPFDADELDPAEVAQPAQQLLVAALGGGEALDAEQRSPLI
jgi:hypothetical protein